MPQYQPPLTSSLREFIAHLKDNYNKRTELVNILESLKNLSGDHEQEILLGACIYVMEQIESERIYKYISPRIKYHAGFYKTGSELYEKILTALHIKDNNPLDDKHRLTYLMHFYNHANKPDSEQKETSALSASALLVIKNVMDRLKLTIDLLLKRPPTEKALQKAFSDLPDKFHKERGGSNSAWINQIKFCEKILEKEQKQTNFDYSFRYGLLLHYMLLIEPTYYWRSPTNSVLYKLCRQCLNIENTAQLSDLVKIKYLSSVTSYVAQITPHPEEIKKWNDENFDAKKFFKNTQKAIIASLTILNNSDQDDLLPQSIKDLIDSLSSYASHYGVGLALASGIKWFITKELTFSLATKMILAPEFAVITGLLVLLRSRVQSNVVSTLATTVDPVFKFVFTKPLEMTAWSLHLLHSNIEAMMERPEDNAEFIFSLMRASDTIFSTAQKEKLAYVIDMDQLMQQTKNKKFEYNEIKCAV